MAINHMEIRWEIYDQVSQAKWLQRSVCQREKEEHGIPKAQCWRLGLKRPIWCRSTAKKNPWSSVNWTNFSWAYLMALLMWPTTESHPFLTPQLHSVWKGLTLFQGELITRNINYLFLRRDSKSIIMIFEQHRQANSEKLNKRNPPPGFDQNQ